MVSGWDDDPQLVLPFARSTTVPAISLCPSRTMFIQQGVKKGAPNPLNSVDEFGVSIANFAPDYSHYDLGIQDSLVRDRQQILRQDRDIG